jgi:hypothetical protein
MSILNNSFNSFLASSPSGGGGGGVSGSGTGNFLPKWASSTSLTNSQLFDNGTSVGIGTASPTSGFLLDVNTSGIFRTLLQVGTAVIGSGHTGNLFSDGTIEASVGINIAPINTAFNKTGFYWTSNAFDVFAGNGNISRFGLNSNNGEYFSVKAPFSPASTSGNTGTLNGIRINSGVQPATNQNNNTIQNQLIIDPVINQVNGTGTGSGTLRGIYYNPTVTNLATSPHFAFENTSGDIKFGNFAGTGNRVVMADSLGKLVDQASLTAFSLFYSGNANGIDIDFAGAVARFGIFTKSELYINDTLFELRDDSITDGIQIDYGGGTYKFGKLNGTVTAVNILQISGGTALFSYNGNANGINFDFVGDIFEVGSIGGNAKISLDNGNSEVIISNSQSAGFTEIQANEIRLTGANLDVAAGGGGAKRYLLLTVNSQVYSIEMTEYP